MNKKNKEQELLKATLQTLEDAERVLERHTAHEEVMQEALDELLINNDISSVDITSDERNTLLEKYGVEDYLDSYYYKSWDEIVTEAQSRYKEDITIDDLLLDYQLESANHNIKEMHIQFKEFHKLDAIDYSISVIGGILGALIDIILIELPTDPSHRLNEGSLAKWIRRRIEDSIPPGTGAAEARVPFDMPYNTEDLEIRIEGLSANFHRLYELGHDPIIGLIAGTLDILKGTITTIDKGGKFVIQKTSFNNKETEANIIKAFLKEIKHLRSDITTPAGLPAPFMCLFNLLDVEDFSVPVEEIIKGMYWDGYDAIHFISMTVPVLVEELFVRVCYSIKRIKEGYSIKNSLAITDNRSKRPKLGTMLFITHTISAAINAGKVKITKNVLNINYPQWIMFCYRFYKQMLWIFITKPDMQHEYVLNNLEEARNKILQSLAPIEV